MFSRSAIQASRIVVLDRSSCASLTFLGSPLRRALSSASLQPIRFNPCAAKRSALICSASCSAARLRRASRQPLPHRPEPFLNRRLGADPGSSR
ncbi:MAG: hypothetical protein ABSH34_13140 [Verrucomicrobiota bacterium]